MRRLANAPTKDQLDSPRVTDFFQTLEQRCNVYESSTDPTADQVPEGQWVFHKNTTTGSVKLWTNDDGTLKYTTLASGVSTTVPAFSAYQSGVQALPAATYTKVQLQTEEFDNSNFFSTVTYRFQPTTAGIYMITGSVAVSTTATEVVAAIYKNGAILRAGTDISASSWSSTVNSLVSFNGTTDYVELFAYSGVAQNLRNTAWGTYFQGYYVSS